MMCQREVRALVEQGSPNFGRGSRVGFPQLAKIAGALVHLQFGFQIWGAGASCCQMPQNTQVFPTIFCCCTPPAGLNMHIAYSI